MDHPTLTDKEDASVIWQIRDHYESALRFNYLLAFETSDNAKDVFT